MDRPKPGRHAAGIALRLPRFRRYSTATVILLRENRPPTLRSGKNETRLFESIRSMRKQQSIALTLCCVNDWRRSTTIAFWLVACVFLLVALVLAGMNQSDGSSDSKNNLDTARNLATGRGYTSNIVQQFYVFQPLPHPEAIRTPGITFLMAGMIWLFGFSPALPVLLNTATVLATAWLLRRAIQVAGGDWFASVAGILVLISGHYQMVSLWNNNLLVLCTVGLLWVGAKQEHQGWAKWKVVAACAVITAIGFLTKPTFIVTAVPFAAFLLLTGRHEGRLPWRQAAARFATFLVLVSVLTSPYWVRNLILFGKPLFSPSAVARLAIRYGGMPYGEFTTVRFGQPLTYGEMLQIHGIGGMVRKDLAMIGETAGRALLQNPPIYLLILVAPVVFPAWRTRREYLLAVLAVAEPIFAAALYWHVEARYLWPIYPCLLYLAALGVRDYRLRPMPRESRLPRVAIAAGLLVLAVGYGVFHGQRAWGWFVQEARETPPAWVQQVAATPPDALILTDDPFSVAWYADRKAVRLPGGPRQDLLRVLQLYRPTHCLLTGLGARERGPLAFGQGDLRLLAAQDASGHQAAWQFYQTEIPLSVATAPGAAHSCPLSRGE